ncbi:MAG TPA: hypothetical protein GX398_03030 [Candidatus Cloacimonetes bacterium]|jgi:hypothetical protein|uniref:hypothetical protein n=1 Tax=Petrimonas mucosa TaxID=1642646 RepID=UPI001772ADD0|nr:hypothetical protein [Petrimonas mucosa]HHT30495.1 hypothetical protein [Petrimonas mucosa]HHZ15070.1 hypothetical protein [Candidatus Cloacimonadota bacterium]
MNATFVFSVGFVAFTDEGTGDAMLFIHEWNSWSLTFAIVNLPIPAKQCRMIAFYLPCFRKQKQSKTLNYP